MYGPPSYQVDARDSWLAAAAKEGTLPPSHFWNTSGRGYPDISALAVSGNVMNGVWGLSGGTSSSSPFFAGLVALLNAARLEAVRTFHAA